MNANIVELPADAGLSKALEIIKAGAIAKEWGKTQSLLRMGITHKNNGNDNFYLSENDVVRLNTIINDYGILMGTIVLKDEPQSVSMFPVFGGNDWVEKFKNINKIFRQRYIFNCMGKNDMWVKNRLNVRTASCYNKFLPDEVERINAIIQEASLFLRTIKLKYQSNK